MSTCSQDSTPVMPRWRQACWVVIGLGFDWLCAFEWFSGKTSFYSGLVLGRTSLIVLVCATLALIAVSVTREAKWQHASPIFFAFSFVAYDILSVYWFAHP